MAHVCDPVEPLSPVSNFNGMSAILDPASVKPSQATAISARDGPTGQQPRVYPQLIADDVGMAENLRLAQCAVHPFSAPVRLHGILCDTVAAAANLNANQLRAARLATLDHWKKRALELTSATAAARESMPQTVRIAGGAC